MSMFLGSCKSRAPAPAWRQRVATWRAALAALVCCLPLQPTHADTPKTEPAPNAAFEQLSALYARYLAGGRSELEIHLSAAGRGASAHTRVQSDGIVSCRVAGLQAAPGAAPQLAALLIHEVTHCLVAPYMAELASPGEQPAAVAATWLLGLMAESISDARVVIEVFRADGEPAAKSLVARMQRQRQHSTSLSHMTALALDAALLDVQARPQGLGSAAAAFARALEIGRLAALQTLSQQLHTQGRQALLASTEFTAASAGAVAALARARQAFEHGRYGNHAVTLRRVPDKVTEGDQHVFIDAQGGVRRVDVISDEGAHSLAWLQAMVGASQASEHLLAVQWLRQEGRLDTHSLVRARQIMASFIRAVSGGQAAQAELATRLMGQTITESGHSGDLSELLDRTAQRIQLAAGR